MMPTVIFDVNSKPMMAGPTEISDLVIQYSSNTKSYETSPAIRKDRERTSPRNASTTEMPDPKVANNASPHFPIRALWKW
jgi:hypothetical protein